MKPVTTHKTEHPRAGICPLGGALFRGVIPHEAGHVSFDLKSVHDAFADQVVKALKFFLCLSHVSNIACDESATLDVKPDAIGTNNCAKPARWCGFGAKVIPCAAGYPRILPDVTSGCFASTALGLRVEGLFPTDKRIAQWVCPN